MGTRDNKDKTYKSKDNELYTKKIKRKQTFDANSAKAVRYFLSNDEKLYGNTCQIRGIGSKMR